MPAAPAGDPNDPGPWAKSSGRGPWAPLPDQTIGPIPGYPEEGVRAWRKANDQVFLDAANDYNRQHGLKPGDPGYWTAMRLKAQAMIESGGDPEVFATDPLQVNKPGDWDKRKPSIGLRQGQAMTPDQSAAAALKWLNFKGTIHDDRGQPAGWRGNFGALAGYNGKPEITSGSDGQPHNLWYANRILQLEQAASPGDGRE